MIGKITDLIDKLFRSEKFWDINTTDENSIVREHTFFSQSQFLPFDYYYYFIRAPEFLLYLNVLLVCLRKSNGCVKMALIFY